jgi:hypothetical protein
MPARKRYKIEKKIRDHNRKVKKQAKLKEHSKSKLMLLKHKVVDLLKLT